MVAPIDANWAKIDISANNLNKTTYGQGTSFPSTWPVDRVFWRTDTNLIYKNTGTEGTPVWSVLGIQSGTVFPTNPLKGDLFNHINIPCLYQFGNNNNNKNIWGGINFFSIYDDGIGYADQSTYDTYWVTTDTVKVRGNPSNDNIDFTFNVDSADKHIYLDLNQTLSNTLWVCRFRVRFSSLVSNTNAGLMVLLSDSTNDFNDNQDSIGIYIRNETVSKLYSVVDSDGIAPSIDTNSATITWATATDYFIEIKRTSATAYTVSVFSDSAFTTLVVSAVSGTTASTNINLRYFKLLNIIGASVGTLNGIIDEIHIIDGRTNFT